MVLRQRLDDVVDRFNILERRMADGPAPDVFVELSREYAELEPLVRSVNALREAERELADLDEMARGGDDVAELAREERAPFQHGSSILKTRSGWHSFQRTRPTTRTPFSRCALERADRKQRCSPGTCSACTSASPRKRTGLWRC